MEFYSIADMDIIRFIDPGHRLEHAGMQAGGI